MLADGGTLSTKTSRITMSGGIRIDGSVFTYHEIMSGGVLLDGAATLGADITYLTMQGGCKVGGQSNINEQLSATFIGGAADVTAIYDATLETGEYSIIASGTKNVPPIITSYAAVAWFKLKISDDTLHYHIVHNLDSPNQVSIRGPADEHSTTSGMLLSPPWGSPIIGAVTLPLPTDVPITVSTIQDGLAYLQLAKGSEYIRAQIVSTSAKLSGHVSEVHDIEMSGGVVASGIAHQYSYANKLMSGGLIADGEGRTEASYNPRPFWNGVRISGLTENFVRRDCDMAGGIKVDGRMTFLYTSNEEMRGGILLDAANVYSFEVPVGLGSLIAAGDAPGEWWAWPPTDGGVVTDGQGGQTFIDYVDGLAGLRAGGAARLGFTKYIYPSIKKGYCRAMASENICTAQADTAELIPPTNDVSPTLSDNRFQILEGSGWRDPTDSNDYAMLPPIVKNRQNTYLPPKNPTRRKATSLTQFAVVTNSS